MQNTDFERGTRRPVGLYLVIGVLAVIGAITLVGWVFGTVLGFLFKLLIIGAVVAAVVIAIRALARR